MLHCGGGPLLAVVVGQMPAARVTRDLGLDGKVRRRWRVTTDSQHRLPVAPNTLNQQFSVSAADTRWVVDLTYIPIDGGFG